MAKTASQTIEKKTDVIPVVVFLGHVDHGKTSIVDYIRKSKIAEKEVGGITQHIGAYQVSQNGKKITIIDTPGHEAFSQIRSRGAKITDVAVLVVAADDGVMPQTKESIAHIKSAKIPFVVAVNKMDLPGANIEKVKKQLAEQEVLVEGYGGDVVVVPVSAKTGEGIPDLLEMIHLVVEVSEVKKDPAGKFEGVVIESFLDKFRGPMATIVVRAGSLNVGEEVFGDTASGKVKSIINSDGENVKEAFVSDPVMLLGLNSVPTVGDTLIKDEKEKAEAANVSGRAERDWSAAPKVSEIRIIIKADTYNSLEAISNSIESLKTDDQEVRFIHKETGDVTENDILLAASAKALIIGFNVKVASGVAKVAEEEKVLIRSYNLIYELLDELKEGLSALSEAKKKKDVVGEAEVLAKFESDEGVIAGCKVTKGRINVADSIAIIRDGKDPKETKIKSMKHKLSDIKEAEEGKEFGIIFESKVNFDKGDIIQATKKE